MKHIDAIEYENRKKNTKVTSDSPITELFPPFCNGTLTI
jgi:hypothetical protein